VAAPVFTAAGTFQGSASTATPGIPAGTVADDILLLFVESENEAVTLSTAQGFVEIGQAGQGTAGGATSSRIAVFWKRATGSDSAPTVADAGDHVACRILGFRGCKTSGNPWNGTPTWTHDAVSDTTLDAAGPTTTAADCLVVIGAANIIDTNTSQTVNYTNGNLTGLAGTGAGDNTNQGTGGGFNVGTGVKATAGAVGNTTVTWGANTQKSVVVLALEPPNPSETGDVTSTAILTGVESRVAEGTSVGASVQERRNLFPNPITATNLSPWNLAADAGTQVLTHQTSLPGSPPFGITTGFFLQIDGNDDANWNAGSVLTVGRAYTFSIYGYAPADSPGFLQLEGPYTGSFEPHTVLTWHKQTLDATGTWQRLAVTFQAAATSLQIRVGGGAAAGSKAYFTAALLEESAALNDFFYPSLHRTLDASQVPSLEALFESEDIVGKNDGDSISQWDDSSGNGKHATQATGGNQPVYKTGIANGLPVVRFDGTSDYLTASALINDDASRTLVVVAKPRTNANTGLIGWWNRAGFSVSSQRWLYKTSESDTDVDLGPIVVGGFAVLTVRWDSASSAGASLDGAPLTVFDPWDSFQAGGTALDIGMQGGGPGFWDGDIASVLLSSAATADSDLQAVVHGLYRKYVFTAPAGLESGGSWSGGIDNSVGLLPLASEALADSGTGLSAAAHTGVEEVFTPDPTDSGTVTTAATYAQVEAVVDAGALTSAATHVGVQTVIDAGGLSSVTVLAGVEARAETGALTTAAVLAGTEQVVSGDVTDSGTVTTVATPMGLDALADAAAQTTIAAHAAAIALVDAGSQAGSATHAFAEAVADSGGVIIAGAHTGLEAKAEVVAVTTAATHAGVETLTTTDAVTTVAVHAVVPTLQDAGVVTTVAVHTGLDAKADSGSLLTAGTHTGLEAHGQTAALTSVAATTGVETVIADGTVTSVVTHDYRTSGEVTSVAVHAGVPTSQDAGAFTTVALTTGVDAAADTGGSTSVAVHAGLDAQAASGVNTSAATQTLAAETLIAAADLLTISIQSGSDQFDVVAVGDVTTGSSFSAQETLLATGLDTTTAGIAGTEAKAEAGASTSSATHAGVETAATSGALAATSTHQGLEAAASTGDVTAATSPTGSETRSESSAVTTSASYTAVEVSYETGSASTSALLESVTTWAEAGAIATVANLFGLPGTADVGGLTVLNLFEGLEDVVSDVFEQGLVSTVALLTGADATGAEGALLTVALLVGDETGAPATPVGRRMGVLGSVSGNRRTEAGISGATVTVNGKRTGVKGV
jgi:hypothetical protein